jgi:hypothetical protein
MASNNKIELRRVNINLPSELVSKVEDYARDLGVNTTSAYIVLLNQALNQDQQVKSLPAMLKVYDLLIKNPQMTKLFDDINEESISPELKEKKSLFIESEK